MSDFTKKTDGLLFTSNYNQQKIDSLCPLVVLAGPTAVGKTAASVALAKAIGGEIISADSMQVYKGMDIGSAKITQIEMQDVPHHLIDILDPKEEFNVLIFQKFAKQAIKEIYNRGHIPILVGGTGFYIQAVLNDIAFTEEVSSPYREELEQIAKEKGKHVLYEQLCIVDPDSAKNIHENNVRRVIRALEFYNLNGYTLSQHNKQERSKSSPYLFRYYVLCQTREKLYQKIEKRVDNMIEEGLLEEVERLRQSGCTKDLVSMQGLGYKEILDFLEKKVTLEKAISLIKENTRHFAKRQLTWFRREKEVTWLDVDDFSEQLELVEELVNDFKNHIGCKLN